MLAAAHHLSELASCEALTELPAALGHRTPVDRVNPKSGRLDPGVGQFRAWLVDRRDGASPLDDALSTTLDWRRR